jgi:hypothetical protein
MLQASSTPAPIMNLSAVSIPVHVRSAMPKTGVAPVAAQQPETPARPVARLSDDVRDKLATARSRVDDLRRGMQEAKVTARDEAKARSRQKLEQLGKQFRLIRELYSANPKEMARQLARLARELKDELKAYAKATESNGAYVSKSPPGDVASGAPASTEASATSTASPSAPRSPSHADAERESRAMSAHADLDFTSLVKGFLKLLREELTKAKIGAAASAPDRDDRNDPFKDADTALKEIDQSIDDLEKSAKADLPIPGTLVSEIA